MYLEPWMIVSIIVAFGICAVYNRRVGFANGGIVALELLIEKKIIRITDEGEVKKY